MNDSTSSSTTTLSHPVVCVTGVTGFIASHIVAQLLNNGYIVHGTARNPQREDSIGFLKQLLPKGEKEKRLHLFKADLLTPNSFDKAIEGCNAVIHTASPVVNNAKDPQLELVDPAVKGTLNVLQSCSKTDTVQKVIVLSSCSTVDNGGGKRKQGKTITTSTRRRKIPFTEKDWNRVSNLKENPYAYGKTQAEEAAYKFVYNLPKDKRFKLTTVLPAVVIGPQYTKRLPMSNKSISILLQGAYWKFCPPMYAPYVDVRDVARAHRFLLETQNTEGRYLVTGPSPMVWMSHTAQILRKHFPSFPVPYIPMPVWVVQLSAVFDKRMNGSLIMEYLSGDHPGFNDEKIRNSGFKYKYSLEEAIRDTAKSLIQHGIVVNKSQVYKGSKIIQIVIAVILGLLFGRYMGIGSRL